MTAAAFLAFASDTPNNNGPDLVCVDPPSEFDDTAWNYDLIDIIPSNTSFIPDVKWNGRTVGEGDMKVELSTKPTSLGSVTVSLRGNAGLSFSPPYAGTNRQGFGAILEFRPEVRHDLVKNEC